MTTHVSHKEKGKKRSGKAPDPVEAPVSSLALTVPPANPKAAAPLNPQPERAGFSTHWQWGLILLVILAIALIRSRLLDFPLERDEGEYAYSGQLILQGIPPYQLAYNMKLPGTYAAYAAIMAVFGQTTTGIHIGLLLINAATIVLVFLLTRKLYGPLAGIVAGASYGLLSVSPSVLGFAGHATHFVVLPATAGLLMLLLGIESKKLWQFFLSGVLGGLAFLMKQPGIFLTLFMGLFLIYDAWKTPNRWRNLVTRTMAFGLGVLAPFGLTCFILYRAGVFQRFWFWTFSYARQYGGIHNLASGFREFSVTFPHAAVPMILLWLIAAAGLYAFTWNKKARVHGVFSVGFLVFSFLAVCPGLYFRPHYYILLLPALSLMAGVGVMSTTEAFSQSPRLYSWRFVPVGVFVFSIAAHVFAMSLIFLRLDPATASHVVYGIAPFPEAVHVAEYIKSHTAENAQIVVFGSEPEIYFYAHRHSGTGYIYMYPLMEEQKYALTMQKDMISEIEAARPDFFVVMSGPPSTYWMMTPGSEKMVFDWGQKYVFANYSLVGVVDVLQHSEYHWDEDARKYPLRSPMNILVFKRNAT